LEKLERYIKDLSMKINGIIEDDVVGSSAAMVQTLTKDSNDDVFILFNKTAEQQNKYSTSRRILNLCIILDEDTKGINLLKLLNLIKHNPLKYGEGEKKFNSIYENSLSLIRAIKSSKTFEEWIYLRDKVIAHRDYNFNSNNIELNVGVASKIIEFVLIIFNDILQYCGKDKIEEPNYNEKSSLYKLFVLMTDETKN